MLTNFLFNLFTKKLKFKREISSLGCKAQLSALLYSLFTFARWQHHCDVSLANT